MARTLHGPTFDPRGTGFEERPVLRSRQISTVSVPTGDYRHITAVREGRISFEVFAKNPQEKAALRLSKIKEKVENLGGETETDDAQEVVLEGSPESVSLDDTAVREEEGQEGVLRTRKQTRKRKKSPEKSEQHLSQEKKKKGRRPQAVKTGDKRKKHKKESVRARLDKIKGRK